MLTDKEIVGGYGSTFEECEFRKPQTERSQLERERNFGGKNGADGQKKSN